MLKIIKENIDLVHKKLKKERRNKKYMRYRKQKVKFQI